MSWLCVSPRLQRVRFQSDSGFIMFSTCRRLRYLARSLHSTEHARLGTDFRNAKMHLAVYSSTTIKSRTTHFSLVTDAKNSKTLSELLKLRMRSSYDPITCPAVRSATTPNVCLGSLQHCLFVQTPAAVYTRRTNGTCTAEGIAIALTVEEGKLPMQVICCSVQMSCILHHHHTQFCGALFATAL